MRHSFPQGALCAALLTPLLAPLPTAAASDPEIAELRASLNQIKNQYERRIADLESRLATAERQAARAARESEAAAKQAQAAAAESRPMTAPTVSPAAPSPAAQSGGVLGALTSGSAFNPQIAVILDGNYYHDGIGGAGSALVGAAYQPSQLAPHTHGEEAVGEAGAHSHGAAANGFNFREAELSFTATVDPYFDAALFIAIDGDGEVELEEGWFQTRGLPYGLRMKGGKFLSDFGYINKQHPHQWDFVDQNLPYLNLLGAHGLQDTGAQLTWLPPLPFYTLLGAELAQGDQERFGAVADADQRALLADNAGYLGEENEGPRLWTAFAKVAPNLPERHALQFGASYARNNQHQEVQGHTHEVAAEQADEHEHEHEEIVHYNALAGYADIWGLDLVYKYDGGGAEGHKGFKFQTEYLRSTKDLSIRSSPHPEALGASRDFTSDGLYAQAVYGFAPKWTAGLRYDIFGMTNEVTGGPTSQDFGSSNRWTLDITWNLSEFSRLRAQYAKNDILEEPGQRERFDAFYLQFLMSMGSHGAHVF
jgi:hypothetical protein